MSYRLLPDIAIADIAFEAESDSADGLFRACAEALTDIMVEREGVNEVLTKEIDLEATDRDGLLYDFLTELIVIKDVESTLFRSFDVRVEAGGRSLRAVLKGETIDRERHILRNDVKAVTMHMFGVAEEDSRLKATVVLDI